MTGMRNPSTTEITVRNLLGAVAWAGVLLQLVLSLRMAASNGKTPLQGLVVYFGYFTLLTNLFIALICAAHWRRSGSAFGRWLQRPVVLGCATTAILLVGLAYHFLLREIWSPQGAQWLSDGVLHYVVPLLALVHWWFLSHREPLPWSVVPCWCLYPIVYFAYALVRGEILESYPYPFIDVTEIGYARALVNAMALLVGFTGLGFVVLGISRIRSKP